MNDFKSTKSRRYEGFSARLQELEEEMDELYLELIACSDTDIEYYFDHKMSRSIGRRHITPLHTPECSSEMPLTPGSSAGMSYDQRDDRYNDIHAVRSMANAARMREMAISLEDSYGKTMQKLDDAVADFIALASHFTGVESVNTCPICPDRRSWAQAVSDILDMPIDYYGLHLTAPMLKWATIEAKRRAEVCASIIKCRTQSFIMDLMHTEEDIERYNECMRSAEERVKRGDFEQLYQLVRQLPTVQFTSKEQIFAAVALLPYIYPDGGKIITSFTRYNKNTTLYDSKSGPALLIKFAANARYPVCLNITDSHGNEQHAMTNIDAISGIARNEGIIRSFGSKLYSRWHDMVQDAFINRNQYGAIRRIWASSVEVLQYINPSMTEMISELSGTNEHEPLLQRIMSHVQVPITKDYVYTIVEELTGRSAPQCIIRQKITASRRLAVLFRLLYSMRRELDTIIINDIEFQPNTSPAVLYGIVMSILEGTVAWYDIPVYITPVFKRKLNNDTTQRDGCIIAAGHEIVKNLMH